MSPFLWIVVLLIAMLPIIRSRRKCAPSGSSFCSLFWIVALAVCAFIYVKRNHIEITRLPTIQVSTIHPLPRIAATRVTPPVLRISPSPGVTFTMPATRPTTQFTNQWVEDWSEFQKATHWAGFRAESSETAVTEAESRQQVIDDAATILAQTAVVDPSFAADPRSRDAILPSLKSEIASRLQSGEFIADQVTRKIEKSYGTLYKSYLLIDVPNSTVASLNQFARQALSQTQSAEVMTWASTAGLFIIIILLYAFLNAATKGYFVWKLRAAAMMVLIIAVLVLFAWGS